MSAAASSASSDASSGTLPKTTMNFGIRHPAIPVTPNQADGAPGKMRPKEALRPKLPASTESLSKCSSRRKGQSTSNRASPSILQNFDSTLASLIAESRGITLMEGLRLFLGSETHAMLVDDDLKMWYFSPLALFDMWENEVITGDPRNSLYLRGDEIA